MIITEKRSIDDICKSLNIEKEIFVIGCAACATKCQTGGDKELLQIIQELKNRGFKVKDSIVLDTPCDSRIVKKDLGKKIANDNKDIQLLICACGSGVQTLSSEFFSVPIVSGLNTVYIGSTKRIGETLEYCKACGNCRLMEFEAICPVTRCPKGMVNAPCGGMIEGFCEIYPDKECIWSVIYKKTGNIGAYKEPKKFSKK